jgi:hypothetical protein
MFALYVGGSNTFELQQSMTHFTILWIVLFLFATKYKLCEGKDLVHGAV